VIALLQDCRARSCDGATFACGYIGARYSTVAPFVHAVLASRRCEGDFRQRGRSVLLSCSRS
jgi:hypothetical protein